MAIDIKKIKADLEQKVAECLALAFDGKVDEALEVFEKKPYLINAFKKLHHKVNRNATYDFDEAYVHSLTNTQLSNLIKFYTNYETRFYFRGSVSAIPYLINLLGERNYENYEELFDWTIEIANSKNPYIPFGTIRYSECKSLKEYEYMLAERGKWVTRGEEDAEFRHKVRLELQKIKDAKNIWGAIRRKDIAAIKVMIDRGLDFNASNDDGLTIQQALAKQEICL
jgi:hypothetical protein